MACTGGAVEGILPVYAKVGESSQVCIGWWLTARVVISAMFPAVLGRSELEFESSASRKGWDTE